MTFASRLAPGTQFEDELLDMLSGNPAVKSVVRNGTEHTHPQFVELLRSNETEGARRIRYAPDGVLLRHTGEVLHFDAKAAHTLERGAYETYMAYHAMGCPVVVYVKHEGVVYWQYVHKIELIPGEETVGRFPPHRRHPVKDGWVYPRLKPGFQSSGHNSGTPYREIDFASMRVWRG